MSSGDRRAPRCLVAMPMLAATLLLAVGCGGSASPRWVVAWSAAMQGVARGPGLPLPSGEAVDQTLRLIAPLTASGGELRIELSNVYGAAPVTFSAITAAVRASGAAISARSLRTVTFAGQSGVTIPSGAVSISDPVSLRVQAGEALAVSAYIAGHSPNATWHLSQPTTSYFTPAASGDHATEESGASFTLASGAVPWLANVDVLSRAERGAVVVIGDSLTVGSKLAPNQQARWTDVLARRLQRLPMGQRESVANEGIGGDGLTQAGSVGGVPSGQSRFERDVLQQPGVDAVIIELGINDLAAGVSAETIEQALSGLVARAKRAGLRVLVATVPPAALIPTVDRPNQLAVNSWILTHTARDDVVNLATTLDDPSNPGELNPAYDSGDHVHPNALGDRAIGDSVSLDALER